MQESISTWRFILSVLAIWRLTQLLPEQHGPWDLIARLRAKLGRGIIGRLMDCFFRLSLWISLPMTIWLSSGWIGLVLQWQALSGAACLMEKITGRWEPAHPSIPPLEGDTSCVVIKNEAQ